jgi:RNA polymerase sigma factor (sigma-70 family)
VFLVFDRFLSTHAFGEECRSDIRSKQNHCDAREKMDAEECRPRLFRAHPDHVNMKHFRAAPAPRTVVPFASLMVAAESAQLREFANSRENPLQMVECIEIWTAVNKALQALPEIYREIFVLRDVQGFTVAECVESLGITAQAVKVRLHRARLMLREKLASKYRLR